jgi:thymidine phosphorylase
VISAADVIRTKRDGGRLSDAQIDWVIAAYIEGEVAEEQMAALAMAIFLRGMDPGELQRWTSAMVASGARMGFTDLGRPTVDKHSTGGVGDTTTLILAPLVAACGAAVPQVSGRGLGHTGGTLDKLEAIPGWRSALSGAALTAQLRDVGAAICAAGPDLAPADRKLYALRDVTATVESIPLIASSIMSKKIAGGADALVLDVKTGSGALLPDPQQARLLARTMVDLGTAAGVDTRALLTAMDVPLGRTAGNAVEVAEAVEVLAGGGPPDLVELTLLLAREMLGAAGVPADPAEALADGTAMDVWRRMIRAQGGDPDAALPRARFTHTLVAQSAGVMTRLDALAIGRAVWRLGAGRTRKEDAVSAAAGARWHVVPGDSVSAGAPLLTLFTDEESRLQPALDIAAGAVAVGPPGSDWSRLPLVLERVA